MRVQCVCYQANLDFSVAASKQKLKKQLLGVKSAEYDAVDHPFLLSSHLKRKQQHLYYNTNTLCTTVSLTLTLIE